ncbi:hypothetical protein pb186bvf_001092 [Paramecium bursaria]
MQVKVRDIYLILETRCQRGNLYIGNVKSTQKFYLQNYKIGSIINLLPNNDIKIQNIVVKQFQPNEQDKLNALYQIIQASEFIQENILKSNILVCCNTGNFDSVAFVIGFLMETFLWDYDDGYEFINRVIKPIDKGFYKGILNEYFFEKIKPQISSENPFDFIIQNQNELSKGNLILGSYDTLDHLEMLKVSGVVSIIDDIRPKVKMNHYYKPFGDHPRCKIGTIFQETFDFIEENLKDGNVVVHCAMGMSRSATIVIAYMMRKYHMRIFQAYKHVKLRRPVVNPNEGFVQQLYELDVQLYG